MNVELGTGWPPATVTSVESGDMLSVPDDRVRHLVGVDDVVGAIDAEHRGIGQQRERAACCCR